MIGMNVRNNYDLNISSETLPVETHNCTCLFRIYCKSCSEHWLVRLQADCLSFFYTTFVVLKSENSGSVWNLGGLTWQQHIQVLIMSSLSPEVWRKWVFGGFVAGFPKSTRNCVIYVTAGNWRWSLRSRLGCEILWSIRLYVCLFVCLSVCLSVCPLVYLNEKLSWVSNGLNQKDQGNTGQEWNAEGDGRLRPGAATWRTARNICVVFDSGPLASLCETMTSSTKL